MGRTTVDVRVTGGAGPMTTVYLVTPLTKAAKDWVATYVDPAAMKLGDAIAVETRFLGPILDGMKEDGLVVAPA